MYNNSKVPITVCYSKAGYARTIEQDLNLVVVKVISEMLLPFTI